MPPEERRHIEVIGWNIGADVVDVLLHLMHDIGGFARAHPGGGRSSERHLSARFPGLGQKRRALLRRTLHFAEARGDDGDFDGILYRVVLHGSKDDVGVFVRGLLDDG